MANRSKRWPSFDPAAHRRSVTVADVLRVALGGERESAIMRWASSVWMAWEQAHPAVRTLIDQYDRWVGGLAKGLHAPVSAELNQ